MGKQRIEEIKQEIAQLNIELVEQESNLYVTCSDEQFSKGCGRRVKIKNLIVFCHEWYVQPYS